MNGVVWWEWKWWSSRWRRRNNETISARALTHIYTYIVFLFLPLLLRRRRLFSVFSFFFLFHLLRLFFSIRFEDAAVLLVTVVVVDCARQERTNQDKCCANRNGSRGRTITHFSENIRRSTLMTMDANMHQHPTHIVFVHIDHLFLIPHLNLSAEWIITQRRRMEKKKYIQIELNRIEMECE